MARIVIKTTQRPYKIMTTEGEKKICMCGLSKNLPFCDESHHKTDDENPDLLYQYDEAGKRSALEEEDGEDCCCGGSCCDEKECKDKCGEDCCEDDKECESCCCGEDCCSDDKCDCEDESEVTEKTKPEKHTHSK